MFIWEWFVEEIKWAINGANFILSGLLCVGLYAFFQNKLKINDSLSAYIGLILAIIFDYYIANILVWLLDSISLWPWYNNQFRGIFTEGYFFGTIFTYAIVYYGLSFLIFKDNRNYFLSEQNKYWYVKYIYYVFCYFLALILDYYFVYVILWFWKLIIGLFDLVVWLWKLIIGLFGLK